MKESASGHADLLFPSKYLRTCDLQSRDVSVTIKRVEAGHEMRLAGGASVSKPILHLVESDKMFVLNKTNKNTIADLYGTELLDWVGKRITVFPTTCRGQTGKTVDCMRIRDKVPPDKKSETEPAPANGPEDDEKRRAISEAKEFYELVALGNGDDRKWVEDAIRVKMGLLQAESSQ